MDQNWVFYFLCSHGNQSISRKVQHIKTPIIFEKMEFRSLAAQYVELEIFLTPSQGSILVTFLVSIF